jgi:hypothetical protein
MHLANFFPKKKEEKKQVIYKYIHSRHHPHAPTHGCNTPCSSCFPLQTADTDHIVFLGLPRPLFATPPPRAGTIDGLPTLFGSGAVAGISSSLSESLKSIALARLFTVLKPEDGAVMVVAFADSPFRFDWADTILILRPRMPGLCGGVGVRER